ncbi:hypothetical protein MHZ36_10660 [Staphylococcus sp. ACRSN]|uniref:hypothetical protein n=1 Tax=Staphylococcus sp. ACRSN TaxID=2918214 RepID=UPI001EF3C47C|nr:hypothetical protein [Staphylococcus sp. ACRSN]MCG7339754.1 hypothetical protein [Staphylococcus sp. ACRSN]
MLINIIINIAAVLIVFGIDLYRQNYKQLKFSSILIALTITSIINLIIVGKYDFISVYTNIQFILWTILQLYLNKKVHTFVISQQKFIAFIITSMLSTSLILTYSTSNDSYYMSVPYLAPSIFMIGAIVVFYSSFQPNEQAKIGFMQRIKHPVLVGQILMILSTTLMTLLTPYWYMFIIIHAIFISFVIWQNIFLHKRG